MSEYGGGGGITTSLTDIMIVQYYNYTFHNTVVDLIVDSFSLQEIRYEYRMCMFCTTLFILYIHFILQSSYKNEIFPWNFQILEKLHKSTISHKYGGFAHAYSPATIQMPSYKFGWTTRLTNHIQNFQYISVVKTFLWNLAKFLASKSINDCYRFISIQGFAPKSKPCFNVHHTLPHLSFILLPFCNYGPSKP